MPDSDNHSSGRLSFVAGPIGNLEDITYRAVRTLREADLIAAEDTRRARILLQHYDISCKLVCYNKDNEGRRDASLVARVRDEGLHVALLADAGTPCLSDPGYVLARHALEAGVELDVIPGPSALTYAVCACGFPVSSFAFGGFLPRKSGKRKRRLAELAQNRTFFVYESPYRIDKLLGEICEVLGEETQVALLREATKMHEEHLRGTAAELLAHAGDRRWRGEFTVAITHDPDA